MVKNTLRIEILAYASEPDKDYNYFGDYVEYREKLYFDRCLEEVKDPEDYSDGSCKTKELFMS